MLGVLNKPTAKPRRYFKGFESHREWYKNSYHPFYATNESKTENHLDKMSDQAGELPTARILFDTENETEEKTPKGLLSRVVKTIIKINSI